MFSAIDDGDIVGGLGHDGLDGILDLDRLAGPQAELRRRLARGVRGHGSRRVEGELPRSSCSKSR